MKPQPVNPIVKPLFVGWAVLYLLYAVLGVWLTTGPDALDNRTHPDTLGDNVFSGVWILLSVAQLVVAVILMKRYKPWLLRTAVALAFLSAGTLIVPSIV